MLTHSTSFALFYSLKRVRKGILFTHLCARRFSEKPRFSLWPELQHLTRRVKPSPESLSCWHFAMSPAAPGALEAEPWHPGLYTPRTRSLKCGHHSTPDFCRGFLISLKNAITPHIMGFPSEPQDKTAEKKSLRTKGKASTNESYFGR